MNKYISKTLLLSIFFIAPGIFAGPEKHDHLQEYKNSVVKQSGPVEEIVLDEAGKVLASAVYYYNKKNQISKIKYLKDGQPDGESVYTYDNSGLSQEELFDNKNKLVEKLNYKYDKLGNVTVFSVIDNEGIELVKWTYQYENKVLTTGNRFVDDTLTESFTRSIQDDGTIVDHIFSAEKEELGRIITKVNHTRVVQREKTDLSGTYIIHYEYDNAGRIIKLIFSESNAKGSKTTKIHEYKYSGDEGVMSEVIEKNYQAVSRN
jgi:antitoxin component YwqK of YwqJK toxin-antitoxin module